MVNFKYYEDRLDTDNLFQLESEIERAKREIKKLKKIIEAPDYCLGRCPSEDVFLSMEQGVLHQAKEKYISLGGVYFKDLEELREEEVVNNLNNLVKIELVKQSFNSSKQKVTIILEEEKPKIYIDNCEFIRDSMFSCIFNKESIINLLKYYKVGEWKDFYSLEGYNMQILDGEVWQVKFVFSKGEDRVCGGYCVYPWNFKDFLGIFGLSRMDFALRKAKMNK